MNKIVSVMAKVMLVVMMVAMLGCNSVRNQIVGKWKVESTKETIEFSKDGSLTIYSAETASGKWTMLDNDRVKVELSGTPLVSVMKITINGDKMSSVDEKNAKDEYTRVK